MNPAHQKVVASHLSRDAYLYVRQSTPRQVFDHDRLTCCRMSEAMQAKATEHRVFANGSPAGSKAVRVPALGVVRMASTAR